MRSSAMTGRRWRTAGRRTARSLAAAVLVTAAATLGAGGADAAATTTTVTERVPTAITAFVPCANAGGGESVTLTGQLLVQTTYTLSAAGNYLITSQNNPQGISGVGVTTGTRYLGTGMTHSTIRYYPGQIQTYVNRFHIVAPAAESLYVKQTFHFTVTPAGTLTTVVDNLSVECG